MIKPCKDTKTGKWKIRHDKKLFFNTLALQITFQLELFYEQGIHVNNLMF